MKRRIFSILTALALCLSLLPTAAWAAEPDEAPDTSAWTVTAFDDLAADVANQTLPQLAEGGEAQGPNLPDTLAATAHQGDGEPQSVDIAVTWEADSAFDQTAPGKYIYTPVLPDGYALAEGVEPPTITVTVEAAPDPQDEPDTQAETPTVVDVPVAHTAGDATTGVWDDQTDISWYTDTETTFTLKTAAELAGLAELVNGGNKFSGKTIYLDADIVLNEEGGTQNWTPIGSSYDNSFRGTFDGQGHTVSGLYVSITQTSTIYVGLFGHVRRGTVRNVNVEGTVTVQSSSSIYAGGVVGYAESATVEKCTYAGEVTGTMTKKESNGAVYIGGIAGYGSGGNVTNCLSSAAVTGEAYIVFAGGVVGENDGGNSVKNCGSIGPVKSIKPDYGMFFNRLGGVVGYSSGTVSDCYSTGSVTSSDTTTQSIGGVMGYSSSSGTVSNCYYLKDENTNANLDAFGFGSGTNVEAKTADEFKSGEVAWLLNDGNTSGSWYQNLGGDADDYPTLDSTHAQVVQLGTAYVNASTEGGKAYYLIYTAAQLQGFASAVNGGSTTINAKLMDDIDLADITWTPIGHYTHNSDNLPFQGTFDGGGHTISNLTVTAANSAGLFGYVGSGGMVQNVNVVNGAVKSTVNSLPYQSRAGGVAAYNSGTVQYCSFSGTVNATSQSAYTDYSYAGGVVGYNYQGTVQYCYHTGTVTATASEQAAAGGIVGEISQGTVQYCYHTGAVTATALVQAAAGGIIGDIRQGTLQYCYNIGAVNAAKADDSYDGGVVGFSLGTVKNCYFLSSSASTGISNGGGTNVEDKPAEAFASGEVAWLLQSLLDDNNTVWVQNLGTDPSPVLAAFLTADEVKNYTVYRVTFQVENSSDTFACANYNKTVTLPDDPNMGEGNALAGWYNGDTAFTADTPVTANLTVTAKVRPDISIDYENETLTGFVSGATYTINGTAVTLGENNTLSAADYMGQTVSIERNGADMPQTLDIPARPTAPTGLQGVNETFAGENDGKITGVTTSMEYKLSNTDTWTACAGTEVTGLAPGSYQVHVAATNDNFASEEANVTIATGDARTYTLNVTAPVFDSAAYGYVQPDAKAVTISNSGNNPSAISNVALSGDTNAFALNEPDGATVQPDGADESYAIRPAAGLSVGIYTATITVTYQDSMTATATVSFTVIPATQDAPTTPTVKSKTYNSMTLETVEDNVNGAAAQYGISTDGGVTWAWQDSPEFTGLSASTAYTFAARYGAVGNYAASAASQIVTTTTSARPSGGSSSTPTYTHTVEKADNGSATVSPKNPSQGDKVTITPKPDSGYEVDSVTVTDKNGKTVKVTDNGDGTYSFTQPASRVTVEVTFTEIQTPVEKLPFTDVPESAYYYDAVAWAVENGITAGTTATTFSPNAACTRAQAVTFLWRAAGSPAPRNATSPFTDVQPGAYYYDAVLWAVENGITVGTNATTFSPNATCTRAQIVTFLHRAAGTTAADGDLFTDVADSAYYAGAVKWAVAGGITTGTTATTFSPDNACTRAQIVTFLCRAEA